MLLARNHPPTNQPNTHCLPYPISDPGLFGLVLLIFFFSVDSRKFFRLSNTHPPTATTPTAGRALGSDFFFIRSQTLPLCEITSARWPVIEWNHTFFSYGFFFHFSLFCFSKGSFLTTSEGSTRLSVKAQCFLRSPKAKPKPKQTGSRRCSGSSSSSRSRSRLSASYMLTQVLLRLLGFGLPARKPCVFVFALS